MKFRRWLDEDEASSTLMVLAQSPYTILRDNPRNISATASPILHEILLERSCFLTDTISGIREKNMEEEEGSLRKSWGQGCSGEPG